MEIEGISLTLLYETTDLPVCNRFLYYNSMEHLGELRDGSVSTVGSNVIYYNGKHIGHMNTQDYRDVPSVKGNSQAWAQGGVAMSLGNRNWKDKAEKPLRSVTTSNENLSALVVKGVSDSVWLIAGAGPCTHTLFRTAIQDYLGITDSPSTDNYTYHGIFLDGGGSTQFVCAEKSITTTRKLCQVITLKSKAN